MVSCKLSALIFAAIVVIVSAGHTKEEKEKHLALHKECTDAAKVEESIFEKASNGDFVEDPAFKKYLFCLSKKLGYMNDAGDIDVEVLRKVLSAKIKDEAVVNEVVTKCTVKKESPEETAFVNAVCYFKVTPENIKFEIPK